MTNLQKGALTELKCQETHDAVMEELKIIKENNNEKVSIQNN